MTPPVDAPSPAMVPYQSTFSEEEIHDILGAMQSDEQHPSAAETSNQQQQVAQQETNEQAAHPGSEITSEARAKARSERKRNREKQRREDVNKQFADLSQLLRQIEAEDLTDEGCKRLPIVSGGPTNRVDLIGRTIVVLERIHKLNKDRKREIEELNKQVGDAKKMAEDTAARLKEATLYQQGPQKQVMMMVPMMMPPDTVNGSTGGPTAGFPGMSPQFLMPQMQQMMMPQMQQMAPTRTPTSAPPVAPTSTTPNPSMMMQQMMPQTQMMPAFNPMMFAAQQSSNTVTATAQSVAAAPPNSQQQVQSQTSGKQQGSSNVVGGNLAHCA
mmetsp:Transcript_4410/g.5098  ORF Transcript_4410/g.5098 Transcript_4410/m.5098 type:complete len:328 (+) Transcript_4410:72-1055(+)|eukprot:CAMPEP_0194146342 /NCGR_PEP_ID=MMETSP0152-20130528/20529_1 /TAXON_ID=1049557 /ORGANISM="Thalassiothrix antarctica, Strain L6-D1" /LENGTH=327 /DNA_ID=CAMNT_0038846833 /DNA_START=15 /DNA_END=998 /DNA_ORIENTATION=+